MSLALIFIPASHPLISTHTTHNSLIHTHTSLIHTHTHTFPPSLHIDHVYIAHKNKHCPKDEILRTEYYLTAEECRDVCSTKPACVSANYFDKTGTKLPSRCQMWMSCSEKKMKNADPDVTTVLYIKKHGQCRGWDYCVVSAEGVIIVLSVPLAYVLCRTIVPTGNNKSSWCILLRFKGK